MHGRKWGLGEWHLEKTQRCRKKIEEALLNAGLDGLTKTEIAKKSHLTRPTIDKHLPTLRTLKLIEQRGKRFYWKSITRLAETSKQARLRELLRINEAYRNLFVDPERAKREIKEMLAKYPQPILREYLREIERTHQEKVEKLEKLESKTNYRIEESGDNLVLRHKQTGHIIAVVTPGFPEDRKGKRKFAYD